VAIVAKLGWKVVSGLAGAAAMTVTRDALDAGWHLLRRADPPLDPQHPSVRLRDAVGWTVATAAGTAAARLVAQRVAASGWEAATGTRPPVSAGKGRKGRKPTTAEVGPRDLRPVIDQRPTAARS